MAKSLALLHQPWTLENHSGMFTRRYSGLHAAVIRVLFRKATVLFNRHLTT